MTQSAAKVLDKELANEPDTFCIVERDHADVVSKPPTKLQNNTLFKPYEMFVEMYGMPAYEEIDPTPLIAISYSILFGFMFGDAGQGLVLLLGGLLLGKFKHSRLASIIGRCGVFSIIFGLLFGSFFGFEDIIKPLWLRPTQAMMTLPMVGNLNTVFIVSIALGMGIILLTMLLNVINRLRFKEPGILCCCHCDHCFIYVWTHTSRWCRFGYYVYHSTTCYFLQRTFKQYSGKARRNYAKRKGNVLCSRLL